VTDIIKPQAPPSTDFRFEGPQNAAQYMLTYLQQAKWSLKTLYLRAVKYRTKNVENYKDRNFVLYTLITQKSDKLTEG
jgi:hypothetical protein